MSVVNADRMHLRDKVRGAYSSAAEQPKATCDCMILRAGNKTAFPTEKPTR